MRLLLLLLPARICGWSARARCCPAAAAPSAERSRTSDCMVVTRVRKYRKACRRCYLKSLHPTPLRSHSIAALEASFAAPQHTVVDSTSLLLYKVQMPAARAQCAVSTRARRSHAGTCTVVVVLALMVCGAPRINEAAAGCCCCCCWLAASRRPERRASTRPIKSRSCDAARRHELRASATASMTV